MQTTQIGRIAALFVALVPALPAGEPEAADRFYAAIRSGDTAAVQQLVKGGADVNSKDSRGTTPLMYAAAAGTADTMRSLIAAGADVNAKNIGESTALMWAAGDIEKVRLLIESGVDVNARSKRGRTAFQIAAAQAGNVEVLRLLLKSGAAISGTPLVDAALANDPAMVALLLEKGQDPNARNPMGLTALMFASAHGNPGIVKTLLARGANVNAKSGPTFGPPVRHGVVALGELTPVLLAAAAGNAETVRLLLEAGADVNAKDVRGMTPLMLAVATDRANPEIIRLLLDKGASQDARSNLGETVQAWAAKFQSPASVPAPKAPKLVPAATSPSMPNDVRGAVEKGVSLMLKSSDTFLKEGGCVGCHAQNATTMAVAAARRKGIAYDQAAAADVARSNYLQFTAFANLLLERLDPPVVEILSYGVFAMDADGTAPDRTTDAMVHNIAAQQHEDGSWGIPGIARPPISDGRISTTALSLRALRQYAPPARQKEMSERVARAARWIVDQPASTTEDLVMQLLAAQWAGLDQSATRPLAQQLLARQRDDGGWAQTTNLKTDAYATGTALYALHQAGAITIADTAYRRGVRYLLSTQAADGSWHVASRAPKFQPYFDGGFPYGHDQWISQMGTAWASVALSAAVPDARAMLR